MTAINVTSVNVLDNPSPVTNPLQFEIQYDCLYDLPDDLEWKLTYVGSAESEKYDQTLDAVYVGPVAPGQYRFVFQADPPNFAALPSSDIVGVTIILLTCSYRNQEFLRVGYYVNNEYVEEQMREEPPTVPVLDKLMRSILSDKPRVTKYPIDWEGNGIVAGGSGAVDTGGSGEAAAEGQAAAGDAMNAGEELADEGEEGGEYDDDEGDLSDEGAAMMED
mmetsp:Transcript_7697/g.20961  ORF Transcript_7697/g.20961 Transcript_7697/m.20961 type:complete len:220 (-) Transcript_7697:74-733(-)